MLKIGHCTYDVIIFVASAASNTWRVEGSFAQFRMTVNVNTTIVAIPSYTHKNRDTIMQSCIRGHESMYPYPNCRAIAIKYENNSIIQ